MIQSLSRTRTLGRTGLEVSSICVGTSPLANMPDLYGYSVDEDRARAMLRAFFAGPFNFLDTSNGYGRGRSERLIGEVLREMGGAPASCVIATKVDADPDTRSLTGERVRRSVSESQERLGFERFQLLHLHDPEHVIDFKTATQPGGVVETLLKLKEEGIAANIGVATDGIETIMEYLTTGVFDVVLNHNHYTLLDRSAEPLIAECTRRGIGFLNAAPYGGGILAKGPAVSQKYFYAPASELMLWKAREMERICERDGVPLAAAALQFSLRDERIHSTVVGLTAPERIEQTRQLAQHPISEALEQELDAIGALQAILT